jgi:flagellar biosynthesis/type III secretory pathway M-ring protein FliF/YscJ
MEQANFYSEVLTMPDNRPVFHLHGTNESEAASVPVPEVTSDTRNLIFWLLMAIMAFVIYEEWMRYRTNQENEQLRQTIAERDKTIEEMPKSEAIGDALLERLKTEGRLVEAPTVNAPAAETPKPVTQPKIKPKKQAEVYSGRNLPYLPSSSKTRN